jgi:cytochrome c nitrite reductase small subunit
VLAIAVGLAIGIACYTFVYAKGYSYLSNDPAACANCHVMEEQYSAWMKSSHRSVAGCNDCHTPPSTIGKYMTKARNGFWHSYYFTTGGYPDPIRILPNDLAITEQACRKCHDDMVDAIDGSPHGGENLQCTRCHRSVGHLH